MDEQQAIVILNSHFRVVLHNMCQQALQTGQDVHALLEREAAVKALPHNIIEDVARAASEDINSFEKALRIYQAKTRTKLYSLWNTYVASNFDSFIQEFAGNQ